MKQVNMHEAKTNFSKLIALVEQGEEIVIARDGRPVARVMPLEPSPRRPGSARGAFVVADAFFEPLPAEMLEPFEN